MNHAEAHSHMPDYLEGDLGLTKRALLDAHLDACESCSREYAEMRATIALLRGLPDPEPPPFLTETVMRRIREGDARLDFGERLREWVGVLATPQIALPATALAVGLLMASGSFDLRGVPLLGGEATPRSVQIVVPAEAARVPHLTVGSAPPAVARAPRIHITLPGSSASGRVPARVVASEASVPRVVTRWPSNRSLRSPVPLLGDPQALSVPVGNRVSSDRLGPERASLQASAFAPTPDDLTEPRGAAQLDQRIDAMVQRPASFAAEFSSLSLAEQEIWLPALADRARELGRGDEALSALRLVSDRRAVTLAIAFDAELQRAQDRDAVVSRLETGAAFRDGEPAVEDDGSASER